MLKDILSNHHRKYEEVILQSIISHKDKIITGTIFYTLREYEKEDTSLRLTTYSRSRASAPWLLDV